MRATGRPRRLLTSLLAVALVGGLAVAVAVASNQLRLHAKRSLTTQAGKKPIAIANMAPGDSAQRVVVMRNRGRSAIRGIRLELAEKRTPFGTPVPAPAGKATPPGYRWERKCTVIKRGTKRVRRCTTALRIAPSRLVTDPSGLRVSVETCTKPWRRLPGGVPTYRCPGRTRVALAPTRVPVKRPLRRVAPLKPGARLHLRLTFSLPLTAGPQLQGLATGLVPRFVVTAGGR